MDRVVTEHDHPGVDITREAVSEQCGDASFELVLQHPVWTRKDLVVSFPAAIHSSVVRRP